MTNINFAGLASGIDTEALISQMSEATRRQRIAPNKAKVANLQDTNSALKEFKSMLQKLQTVTRSFSTLDGGAISKFATSSNEQFVTASASKSALNGSYDLTVSNLAKNGTVSFETREKTYTSPNDAIIGPLDASVLTANFTIGQAPSAETVNLSFNGFTTLSQFVDLFNAQSTSAIATLVNIGTAANPDYRPVISSKETGLSKGNITVNLGPKILGETSFFQEETLSQAENAKFTMAGIGGEIERSSNTINDLVQGVTFRLQAPGSATITIENDNSQTKEKVQEFIDSYNEIVEFLKEKNQIIREETDRDVKNIFGPLTSTRIDEGAVSALRSAISSSVFSGGSAVRIFADLGITTERDGTLKFDEAKFDQAIESEPGSVDQVLTAFGDQVALTNGILQEYIKFNSLIDLGVQGNDKQISNINERISQAEQFILRQEQMMRQRFARLESVMGQMQSQQAALQSALIGLGGFGK
jgi:flagellar hook-associated protein 2